MNPRWANVRNRLLQIYERADRVSGGSLKILAKAIQSFGAVRAGQAAAAIAFYALFSLFPLFLLVVAIGSFLLEDEEARQQLLRFLLDTIPVSRNLIEQNIQQLLKLRGVAGLVGLISLAWSSTSVFSTLARNIDLAWPERSRRGFLQQRLVALSMVTSLVGLLILVTLAYTVLRLLARFEIPLGSHPPLYETTLWTVLASLLPWVLVVLLLWNVYRWVPRACVRWTHAAWGAVVATIGLRIVTSGFTWYVGSGLARYDVAYGSLGAIAALMFWIYLSALIVLFGAHLSAAVAGHARRSRSAPQGAESDPGAPVDHPVG